MGKEQMIAARLRCARFTAEAYGWKEIDHQEKNRMVSFRRDGTRINVYYSKMTVGTCLKHPTKGFTQLFRRNVTEKMLEKIFNYPRVHTDRGYYVKSH